VTEQPRGAAGFSGPVLRGTALVVSRGGANVLNGVSIDVGRGETVAVQGPSGVGKSTLLGALSGLVPIAGGHVLFDGERVDDWPDRRRAALRLRRFGTVFQDDQFLPELTIAENITLPLRLLGRRGRTDDLVAGLAETIVVLGLSELLDRRPYDVSGGQLQRAAIARATAHEPDVLFADEPTSALDAVTARTSITLMLELARRMGCGAVVVTHDDQIAGLCDRRVEMAPGQ